MVWDILAGHDIGYTENLIDTTTNELVRRNWNPQNNPPLIELGVRYKEFIINYGPIYLEQIQASRRPELFLKSLRDDRKFYAAIKNIYAPRYRHPWQSTKYVQVSDNVRETIDILEQLAIGVNRDDQSSKFTGLDSFYRG